ncbi:MAG: hypothetical protein R3268_01445 [Acidiferrobacterales bacterium]|nr:hypothetical protein [Acidiferrobacterales bacterium]
MARFHGGMERKHWTVLPETSADKATFGKCGNWTKVDLDGAEWELLVRRILLSCVTRYIDSFDNIEGRVMAFHYCNRAAGDCLTIPDDTESGQSKDACRPQRGADSL